MPNTSNAKKALRQNVARRLRNRAQRSALRTVLKKYKTATQGEDPQAAESAFRLVTKQLDQAAAKGLIHKNKAARTKSRLSKLLPRAAAAPAGE
ncbi:MAG: 30S ribosomal protein S20 [Planctomycetes bacterium]|nr:30S ribosomal protein S20 [Planctomycetota bacterium]